MPVKRWVMTAAVALAAVWGVLAVPAGAQAAPGDDYYQLPWSPVVYQGTSGQAVTYEQWVAAGRPAPQPATITYARFPWSATIYRHISLGNFPFEQNHVETGQEWAAAGHPEPVPEDAAYVTLQQYPSSAEVFVTTYDKAVHKLTKAEWDGLGDLTPLVVAAGYYQLTWSSNIAVGQFGKAPVFGPVSYAQWEAADFPTPQRAVRFPGYSFTRVASSSTITYSGPTMHRAITYREWLAAGSPTPKTRS